MKDDDPADENVSDEDLLARTLDPDEIPDLAAEDAKDPDEKLAEAEFEWQRLTEELEKTQGLYARALADYQNLQKRTEKDLERRSVLMRKQILLDFLPLVDTLDRAIAAEEQREEGPDPAELKVIRDQVQDILRRHGVERIPTEGEAFDPNWHEAMGQVPVPDKEAGTIFQELRSGFKMGEDLLRAAQVLVVAGS